MTSCELRKKAAYVIEERGWCQGFHESPTRGAVCMVGALRVAAWGDAQSPPEDQSHELREMYEATKRELRAGLSSSLTQWNDAHERTKEQVLARLREGCE